MFRNNSASSRDEMNISSSLYPAVLPIPSTADISEGKLRRYIDSRFEVAERILHYRVISSANRSSLAAILSVISHFNSDLTDFEPTTALIATWKIRVDEHLNSYFPDESVYVVSHIIISSIFKIGEYSAPNIRFYFLLSLLNYTSQDATCWTLTI